MSNKTATEWPSGPDDVTTYADLLRERDELREQVAVLREALGERADCPHGYKQCCGETVVSETRYTVTVQGDARRYFDSAEDARRFAGYFVYRGQAYEDEDIGALSRGEAVSWSYGFSSVTITPPARAALAKVQP